MLSQRKACLRLKEQLEHVERLARAVALLLARGLQLRARICLRARPCGLRGIGLSRRTVQQGLKLRVRLRLCTRPHGLHDTGLMSCARCSPCCAFQIQKHRARFMRTWKLIGIL